MYASQPSQPLDRQSTPDASTLPWYSHSQSHLQQSQQQPQQQPPHQRPTSLPSGQQQHPQPNPSASSGSSISSSSAPSYLPPSSVANHPSSSYYDYAFMPPPSVPCASDWLAKSSSDDKAEIDLGGSAVSSRQTDRTTDERNSSEFDRFKVEEMEEDDHVFDHGDEEDEEEESRVTKDGSLLPSTTHGSITTGHAEVRFASKGGGFHSIVLGGRLDLPGPSGPFELMSKKHIDLISIQPHRSDLHVTLSTTCDVSDPCRSSIVEGPLGSNLPTSRKRSPKIPSPQVPSERACRRSST